MTEDESDLDELLGLAVIFFFFLDLNFSLLVTLLWSVSNDADPTVFC